MRTITNIDELPKNTKGIILWSECVGSVIRLDDFMVSIVGYDSQKRKFLLQYNDVNFYMTCVEVKNSLKNMSFNRIPFTHNWVIDYFPNGIKEAINYSHGSTKIINMKCPYCKRIKNYRPSYITRRGFMPCICNKTSMSYPEMVMFNLLEAINEDFDREERYNWCVFQIDNEETYGVFDFILIKRNIIIEMDGGFHEKEEVKYRDKQKDILASRNGFKVIRINAEKSNIKFLKENIEKSELRKYIDFLNVDWEQIEIKSRDNIHKIICDYKMQNPDMYVKDIAKHFGLKNDFVRESLKTGNELDWCVYKPKEEVKRSNIQHMNGFKKGVQHDISKKFIEVCMYDLDGNYIKTFSSKKEAVKNYGYGVYLCTQNKEREHCKTAGGYQWRVKTENYKENIGRICR